ncbi:helix-turn-helix domain-containing protein [Sulfurimonas sp. NWX79]|uniref:helix-turn-helix transcriptional regulator n=1 Tax=Sulfurimonas sp. NWX79 TaxID=2925412 RepID=UPI003204CCE4
MDYGVKKENYRVVEAGKYLGVAKSTVWKYIKDGKLKAHKLSPRVTVIHRTELEKFAHIRH